MSVVLFTTNETQMTDALGVRPVAMMTVPQIPESWIQSLTRNPPFFGKMQLKQLDMKPTDADPSFQPLEGSKLEYIVGQGTWTGKLHLGRKHR